MLSEQKSQKNIFIGGLNLDQDPNIVKPDKMTYANDVEVISLNPGDTGDIIPLHSSKESFTVPNVTPTSQMVRIYYGGIGVHTFTITIGTQTITFTANSVVLSTWKSSVQTAIQTPFGAVVTISAGSGNSPQYLTMTITVASVNVRYTITESFGSAIPVYTLRDGIDYTAEMRQLQQFNLEQHQFVFSQAVGQDCMEIGVATRDVNGWTYTRLIRSVQFSFPTTEVIDARGESIANNYWALYFSDNINRPKVVYVPKTYSADCLLKYSPSSFTSATTYGYYTLESVNDQTNLQLINNVGIVTFKTQLQSGGGLLSGGKSYSVRFGINGTQNVTEWSYLTPNAIPVFKTSTNSPSAWVRIQGDPAGGRTGKVNVLTIQNAKSAIFNFVELACVEYAGYNTAVATSAYIVGRFDVTADSFDIQHTGLETGTQLLDVAAIPRVSDVILKAKNLEIKRNILNISNAVIATDDSSMAAIASAATLSTTTSTLTPVGILSSGNTALLNGQYNINYNGIYSDTLLPLNTFSVGGLSWTAPNGPYTVPAGVTKISITPNINFHLADVPGDASATVSFIIKNNVGVQLASTGPIVYHNDNFLTVNDQSYYGAIVETLTLSVTAGDTLLFYMGLAPSGDPITGGTHLDLAPYSVIINNISSLNTADFNSTAVGEYQDPANCANKVGYMLNETVPMFMKIHWKTGYISSGYFIGYFTCSLASSDTMTLYSGLGIPNAIIIYACKISGLNISTIKSQIDGISIWRGVVNPSILGSGLSLLAESFDGVTYNLGVYPSLPTPYVNGDYGTAVNATNPLRKYGMFVCPDFILNRGANFETGDKLTIFGAPYAAYNNPLDYQGYNNGKSFLGSFAEYGGALAGDPNTHLDYTLDDAQYVNFAQDIVNPLRNSDSTIQFYKPHLETNGAKPSMATEGIGFTSHTYILNSHNFVSDNGFAYAQYKRPIVGNQYDLKSIKIVPTGTFVPVTAATPDILPDITVWGGDTYTQKNVIKLCYYAQNKIGGVPLTADIRTSFITYYGQNKHNTQLMFCDPNIAETTWNLQGHQSIYSYLFPFTSSTDVVEEQFNYDNGYSALNIINQELAFNSKITQNANLGAAILYSLSKPVNSVYDFYRIFLPANKRNLEAQYGDISAMYSLNEYMAVIQQDAVTMLPYDADAVLTSTDGRQVYIGSGSVYAARENIVCKFGSAIKTSSLLAVNKNGNPQLYWISPQYSRFCRYGPEGIFIPSDEEQVSSWLVNNMDFVQKEFDIVLGYDNNHRNIFITSRAYNSTISEWAVGTTYHAGDIVKWSSAPLYNFEQLPDFYIALNTTTGNAPPIYSGLWSKLSQTDTRVNNQWTLIYNQQINKFPCFASFLPERYFNFHGETIVPRGQSSWGKCYELLNGTGYLQWLYQADATTGYTLKQGTWAVESVVNLSNDTLKRYLGVNIETTQSHDINNNPSVTITTDSQTSAISASKLKLEYNMLKGGIPYDVNVKPLIDTTAKIKMYGQSYIKLLSLNTIFRWVFPVPKR